MRATRDAGSERRPSHPSGTRPTIDDAESRMTSEGDITTMDEEQAGRMGEGRRGEEQVRHVPPARPAAESADQGSSKGRTTHEPPRGRS